MKLILAAGVFWLIGTCAVFASLLFVKQGWHPWLEITIVAAVSFTLSFTAMYVESRSQK